MYHVMEDILHFGIPDGRPFLMQSPGFGFGTIWPQEAFLKTLGKTNILRQEPDGINRILTCHPLASEVFIGNNKGSNLTVPAMKPNKERNVKKKYTLLWLIGLIFLLGACSSTGSSSNSSNGESNLRPCPFGSDASYQIPCYKKGRALYRAD